MHSSIYEDVFWFDADEAQWVWQKIPELHTGEDLRSIQRMIIRDFWSGLVNANNQSSHGARLPDISMDEDILSEIQYGRCQILEAMFLLCSDSMFSYIVGTRFLDWLVSLDLDPELCVASELANLEKSSKTLNYKRIVFERDWEQKWILGFEWVFDHKAPGYTLVSEYTAMIFERDWDGQKWPFCERDYKSDWRLKVCSALFNRRMAAKERKDRARLGQKQPRSRMPGAWKW
jgi:hypothetical protein